MEIPHHIAVLVTAYDEKKARAMTDQFVEIIQRLHDESLMALGKFNENTFDWEKKE